MDKPDRAPLIPPGHVVKACVAVKAPVKVGVVVLVAAAFGCAGSRIQAFPQPTHRAQDVQMEGARLSAAVAEYVSFEGLDLVRGQGLGGTTVTDWTDAFGIEGGDPPLAECASASAEDEPVYRARYRFDISSRSGIQSLHVLAHWQVANGQALVGETNWQDCRSTGAFERDAQERIVTRARMMSRGIGGG